MKVSKATAIAPAVLGLLMTACGGSLDKSAVDFVGQTKAAAFRLAGSADVFQRDNDLVYSDSVNMLMPSVIHNHDITSLRDSIISLAFDTTGVKTHDIIDDYLTKAAMRTGFDAVPTEDTDSVRLNCDGYEFVTGTVANLTAEYLGYCVTTMYYLPGAAHGMTTRYYVNYDINSGKVFTAADIFTPEGLKELPAVIRKRAQDMSPFTGPVEISDLPSRANFYLSGSGELLFVYQPYEAASYSQGFISVPFFPYELADMMTAYGLKYFNLDDIDG